MRPWIMEDEIQGFVATISYSVPNFIEAVMGTFIVTGFLTYYGWTWFRNMTVLQLIGVVLAGVYVITQELKIHNIGGNNVYDLNDLFASIFGLVFSFLLIRKYGIIDEPLQN
ncbi:MAG: hypothetical protein R8G66_08065 [Cytophagales bacterium]|nr:hypothetical protein [Cytophagales bacterium]